MENQPMENQPSDSDRERIQLQDTQHPQLFRWSLPPEDDSEPSSIRAEAPLIRQVPLAVASSFRLSLFFRGRGRHPLPISRPMRPIYIDAGTQTDITSIAPRGITRPSYRGRSSSRSRQDLQSRLNPIPPRLLPNVAPTAPASFASAAAAVLATSIRCFPENLAEQMCAIPVIQLQLISHRSYPSLGHSWSLFLLSNNTLQSGIQIDILPRSAPTPEETKLGVYKTTMKVRYGLARSFPGATSGTPLHRETLGVAPGLIVRDFVDALRRVGAHRYEFTVPITGNVAWVQDQVSVFHAQSLLADADEVLRAVRNVRLNYSTDPPRIPSNRQSEGLYYP
ncbi:hypothetical protein B0T26DRAFT_730577 [Lasiosphaeria miniovina]|uniref:DUF7770 domain-containing protein n=1 Tax=Lasiosphaeria miniovina TaxID=1954250 RepID=A0AA39ZTK2_9PEZI|nr:uncharacterized protein B0T26DRAFT_730577 [Lasiosphaeria miniovina]KAK0703269.1 hypothetical protein B0T26DRAFT_730577 [Lasiosphaeria miniovina]